jgi:hypothetical protein
VCGGEGKFSELTCKNNNPYFVWEKMQNFKHGSNNCSFIQEIHGDVLKPNIIVFTCQF